MSHGAHGNEALIQARRAALNHRYWIKQPAAYPMFATMVIGAAVVAGITIHQFLNNNSFRVLRTSPLPPFFYKDSPFLFPKEWREANSPVNAIYDRKTGLPKDPNKQ
jgi:hypothetical protein